MKPIQSRCKKINTKYLPYDTTHQVLPNQDTPIKSQSKSQFCYHPASLSLFHKENVIHASHVSRDEPTSLPLQNFPQTRLNSLTNLLILHNPLQARLNIFRSPKHSPFYVIIWLFRDLPRAFRALEILSKKSPLALIQP